MSLAATIGVALLQSAGIDSISTGIECEEIGKEVTAYTYEVHGYTSQEREKVEAIARHLGWRLCMVTRSNPRFGR